MIDEQYLKTPLYGSRRMRVVLRQQGYGVNRKRVQRLMRQLGLEAIYPKPRLTQPHPEHQVYPYLLRNLAVTHANHVWGTDITYLPVLKGPVLPGSSLLSVDGVGEASPVENR